MKRKAGICISVIVVMLLAVVFAFFYFLKRQPRLNVSILQYNQLETDHTDIQLKVNLKNAFPVKIKADDLQLSIEANNEIIAETKDRIPVTLLPFKRNSFTVPVRLYSKKIKEQTKDLTPKSKDSTDYFFNIRLLKASPEFLLPDTIFYTYHRRVPTFKLPVVSLEKIETEHLLNQSKREVYFYIKVINFNNDPIILQNPQYSIQINDSKKVLHGKRNANVTVAANSSKVFKVLLNLDGQKLLKHAGHLLFNKSESKIQIKLDSKLLVENAVLDGCEIHTRISTNLESLLN